jgi:hypothetical protein
MVAETQEQKRNAGAAVFGLSALGLSAAALITALLKPSPALGTTPQQPVNVIVDGDIRTALAGLLAQGEDVKAQLALMDGHLLNIIEAISGIELPTGTTHPIPRVVDLEPFEQKDETLEKGVDFPVYELTAAQGGLIWAIIDVTDPSTTVIFNIDDLYWEFDYATLNDEGIDRPLFPGVWLSKYDPATNHYVLIFSAGNPRGFTFKDHLRVIVRFTGTGSATLTEGRGILWRYV